MIFHFLKNLIGFILPVFYKRLQAKNIQHLKVKGPVIIAMNHPNAFTEPIYLTHLTYPTRLNYLARGDAFKPGFASFMLEQIGIIPIFRMRDGGKEGLKKNDESYQIVNKILAKNGKMIVFAEGLCIMERRLRPLKKGVARMVFGAYEALNTENLVVVPVGVNYSQADKFRSDLFFNIGEPILVKDFIEDYKENPARAQNKFLQFLEPKMKELITHVEDTKNDDLILQVEELCKKERIVARGLNSKDLADDFKVLQELTNELNRAAEQKPELLEELRPLANNYFSQLKKHKLRDWLLSPLYAKQITYFHLIIRSVLLVLGLPLFILGFLGNFLPMFAAHKITLKIIKHKEFYSSFAIGIAMVLYWLNYILIFFMVNMFSPHILWPLCICLVLVFCGHFSLYYYPYFKKTIGMSRLLRNKELANSLRKQRENLVSLINKF